MLSTIYFFKSVLRPAINRLSVALAENAGAKRVAVLLLAGTLMSTASHAQVTTWRGSDPTLTCGTNNFTSNWFTATNWTNGVPTATTDAVIPDSNDNCAVYPEIIASAGNPAVVRTLTVQGNSSLDHSTLVLTSGELQVYGNYVDATGGVLSQAAGTVFTLAGGDQTFDGEAFQNLRIQGTGTKSLGPNVPTATVAQGINFANGNNGNGTVLTTSTAQVSYGIRFLDNSLAAITGENDTNYISGNLSDSEVAVQGQDQVFGGMGLTLNFTSTSPGLVVVVRTTGSTVSAGGKRSISRIFQIRPSTITTSTSATATIQYLNHEVGATLNASQLDFYTSTNGNQFVDRGFTTRSANAVQLQGLANFQYVTLGNPVVLPVTMLYFNAAGVANGAQLKWGTATETDNAGFDVQTSTDGNNFRTLTTVVPRNPSSLVAQDYSYLDTEARTGVHYYRLRQFDLNGQESYTEVRIVKLGGSATAQVVSAYPNPLRDGDKLQLTVQNGQAGNAKLRLTDTMGRVVLEQTNALSEGTSVMSFSQPTTLASGLYMAYVTLPDGSVQTLKVQKQ